MNSKERPLISYVITAYNSEKYIKEAIECAFNQTYQPLQIVLSDDCSKDETFNIMQQMASVYKGQAQIKLNRNEVNMGISQHMSKAYIDLADGEIIVVAHADDISKPDRVEKSYEYFCENPKCNVVSFAITHVDSNKQVIKKSSDFNKVTDRYVYKLDEDSKSVANVPAPSRAFKKEVMTTFGYLDKECTTEDELITFRALLMGGENAYLKYDAVLYRKHENSESNIINFDKYPLFKIYNQLKRDAEKAVELGFITQEFCDKVLKIIQRAHKIRQCYRDWLVKPKLSTVLKIQFKNIPLRAKLSFYKKWLKQRKTEKH